MFSLRSSNDPYSPCKVFPRFPCPYSTHPSFSENSCKLLPRFSQNPIPPSLQNHPTYLSSTGNLPLHSHGSSGHQRVDWNSFRVAPRRGQKTRERGGRRRKTRKREAGRKGQREEREKRGKRATTRAVSQRDEFALIYSLLNRRGLLRCPVLRRHGMQEDEAEKRDRRRGRTRVPVALVARRSGGQRRIRGNERERIIERLVKWGPRDT